MGFDIKVCDYLLNQTDKHYFKSVKNSKRINRLITKTSDINPYFIRSWLGYGNITVMVYNINRS
jgi:hypothetical protein